VLVYVEFAMETGMETAGNDVEVRQGPHRLSWLKRIIRYAVHVFIAYQLASFTVYVVDWSVARLHAQNDQLLFATSSMQFLVSHLVLLSFVPAFVVGLVINAKFRHEVAQDVWIVPVAILAVAFLFGPGMYPTMLWDSDFRGTFHYFFGGGFHLVDFRKHENYLNGLREWERAWAQIRDTMPAYEAIGYSLGALLGMSPKALKLQRYMEKF
jgi:hypothetical protein